MTKEKSKMSGSFVLSIVTILFFVLMLLLYGGSRKNTSEAEFNVGERIFISVSCMRGTIVSINRDDSNTLFYLVKYTEQDLENELISEIDIQRLK